MIKIPDNISIHTKNIIDVYLKNSIDPDILYCFELFFISQQKPEILQSVIFETLDFFVQVAREQNKKILICSENTYIIDKKYNEYCDIIDFVHRGSLSKMTPLLSTTTNYIIALMSPPQSFSMSYYQVQQSLSINGIVQCNFK